MSLNFRLKDIEGYETVCLDGNGNLKPITQELIWNTIRIEMGAITLDEADEFYARLQFMTKLMGAMWMMPDGNGIEVTPEDVIAHIGLNTNVPTVHRARWLTRRHGQIMSILDNDMKLAANVLSGISA